MPRAEPGGPRAAGSPVGLYPRLSAFYLCYFGAIGVLVPFFSFYLQHEGFGAIAIGQLMAIPMAMRILAPGFWGWAADHTGRRDLTLRAGALLATGGAALLWGASGYAAVALGLAAFALPWSGLLPQFEATTLSHLGTRPQRYGLVRLWGSVGFIVAVVLGGLAFSGAGVARVPLVLVAVVAVTALAVWVVPPAPAAPAEHAPQRLGAALRRPWVLALLLVCILQQAAFGPYYVFFTIYLDRLGYSTGAAGLLWAWGVAAEVLMFIFAPRLIERYGSRLLLVGALAVSALRWLLTAWGAAWLPVLVLAQTLHMAAFGLFHAVAVLLVHRAFPGRLQGRGQALYSALGFGVGGALGSLASGYAWAAGGPALTWTGAAVLAGIAAAVAWRGLARNEEAAGPIEAGGATGK
ncbi:MFS transporter [Thioalkalivibrio sp. XN279]|uniref:MFS transporter n=1 Tax=Thioalkalivibrio sp. XN279 TaxID=2714953 RepID=UPI001408B047|nr:MFS transporter [Thioalkalivibrio sp. XN279]NHA15527.1 MFS transporter [Thioalkalivibrio sp. XN279]